MKWPDYQLDIFKNVAIGERNLVVEALAGSAKSTVLRESLKYIPPGLSVLIVAFNKRIAEEMKLRVLEGAEIKTLHSLGLKAIGQNFKNVTVDASKMDHILHAMIGKKYPKDTKYNLQKAISLAKGYLVSTEDEIDAILDDHDFDLGSVERGEFIKLMQLGMHKSQEDHKTVDFDDMIWFPNVLDIKIPQFDRVLVDEGQDLNKAQIELVFKTIRTGQPAKIPKRKSKKEPAKSILPGRALICLDANQNIYAFMGANQNAINGLIERLDAKRLPLSITYRCPLSVVREAQKYVPTLEAAPDAKEGKVSYITKEEMKKIAKPGCVILSRTNAPMIGLALHFIKFGIPANIQGRDIGQNLIQMIRHSKTSTVKEFLEHISRWSRVEIERLKDKNRDFLHIQDKLDCFNTLSSNCISLDDMIETISKLFNDKQDNDLILLSSIHKFKGSEKEIVFILNYSFFPSEDQQELNLKYVACTRSKNLLYYVSM